MNDDNHSVREQEARAQVEQNYEAFKAKINEYIPVYANQYALMRNGEVVEFYSVWQDAWKTGTKFYDDGLFSIQKVTQQPTDLGYFSHAFYIR